MKKKKLKPVVIKDSPADVAKVMRKQALKKTGTGPSFQIFRGWKLGLTYGVVPTPSRENYERFSSSLSKRLGFTDETLPSYERMVDALEIARLRGEQDPHADEWIFSASLHPKGRSSVLEDWRFIGEMACALGAPFDSLKTPFETTNPNDAHYWIWKENMKARN